MTLVTGMDDSPRGRILRAAARRFVRHGFAATTVRDIAADVGIRSGSLFHHFRSKEHLLESVMIEVIELNLARMRDALGQASDSRARLAALIHCELASVTGDTGEAMSLLVGEWRSLGDEGQSRVLALRDRYEGLFLQALRDASATLVDIDPFILRRFLTGIDANARSWFKPDGTLSLDDLTELVMKLLTRMDTGE